jgi:hypothetical protein
MRLLSIANQAWGSVSVNPLQCIEALHLSREVPISPTAPIVLCRSQPEARRAVGRGHPMFLARVERVPAAADPFWSAQVHRLRTPHSRAAPSAPRRCQESVRGTRSAEGRRHLAELRGQLRFGHNSDDRYGGSGVADELPPVVAIPFVRAGSVSVHSPNVSTICISPRYTASMGSRWTCCAAPRRSQ